jgi:protoheme ferro-lyase
LVELDRDYRRVAEASSVPGYWRASTVGTDPRFIAGLARLVRDGSERSATESAESAAEPAR